MPSPFESLIAGNLPQVYAQFGLAATYTPPDGSAVVSGFTVRVHRAETREIEKDRGVIGEQQTAEIMVLQSSLAKPAAFGRFTVEGNEVWTIQTTPVLKNGQHTCACTRSGDGRLMNRSARDA